MRAALVLPILLVAACASSTPPPAHTIDDARIEAPAATRLQCPPGQGDCDGDPGNGCETDLGADVSNCRACGHACASSAMCVDGRCSQ